MVAILGACGSNDGVVDGLGENPTPATFKLKAPEPRAFESFGQAVAAAAGTVVVGAQEDEGDAVYLFERGAGGWEPLEDAPVSADGDGSLFGFAVATDGQTLLVGAPYDRRGAERAGAAYLFERAEEGWVARGPLASGLAPYSYLGTAVAVSGDTAAVAAPGHGANAVFIFKRDADEWHLDGRVGGSGDPAERFGGVIALDGDRLAVSAWSEVDWKGGRETRLATVYLYERTGSGWQLSQTLLEPQVDSDFGRSLSLAAGRLAVGAPSGTPEAVFIYESSDAGWPARPSETVVSAEGVGERFGAALALLGERLVVGAPEFTPDGGPVGSGQAYLYERGEGGWRLVRNLLPPEAQSDLAFGAAIAAAGEIVAVGAAGDEAGGVGSGAVHLFELGE